MQGGYLETVPNITAPGSGNFVTINAVLLAPNSTGSVTLATASAWDDPLLEINFLSTDYDKYALSAGTLSSAVMIMIDSNVSTSTAVTEAKRIASAPSMKGYIEGPYGALADTDTPSQLLDYIKSHTVPNWQ